MTLPDDVWARIQRFAQGYPPPQGVPGDAHDDRCRVWTRCVSEQIRAEFGPEWGTKRASADRPPSKETIARQGAGRLDGWDLLNGAATGRPTLSSDPSYHDIADQVFIPVAAVDRLGRTSSRPMIPQPWIGVTSFDWGPRIASGDTRWLGYLTQGFTVARVIVASNYRMPRTLEEGRAQLTLVLSTLRGTGVRAEVVLLVDTGDNDYTQTEMLDHVAACNTIMVTYADTIALVEIANEIGHGSQSAHLFDIDFLDKISALVDVRFPLAWGGEFEGGNIVTLHSDRGQTPEANGKIMGDRQAACGKPIIDDEPLGIAEVSRAGARTDDPDYARRLAVAANANGLAGVTLHHDAGLFTTVDAIGPVHTEATRVFLSELMIVPPIPPGPGHPILDAPVTPGIPTGYQFWVSNYRALEVEAHDWYLRATGRIPADADIAHGLWRCLYEGDRWQTPRAAFEETWPGGAP